VETIVYKGIVFRRYPDSPHRTDRVYFTPSGTHRARGVKRLHQEIWEDSYGPIPPGHHIHHRDNNPLNNDLANLECIPLGKHRSDHRKQTNDALGPEIITAQLDRIRPLSKAWHQTPEGKRHHKKLALNMRPKAREAFICIHCGKSFEAYRAQRNPQNRYCSAACNSAHRRSLGLDNEVRECVVCGSPFETNRYYKTETCSPPCANKLRSLRKK